jgi:hypothetical protein
MARTRFTKNEREAFTPGTAIEWRNGAHWHPGVIAGDIYTSNGWQYVPVTHRGRTTATVATGQCVTNRPATVRLPVS